LYGFDAADYKPPEIGVWPENIAIVDAFVAMRTQWRISHYGATGLDYGVLPVVLEMVGVPKGEWADVFEGIRVMESIELEHLRRRDKAVELAEQAEGSNG
jgi:hypothetical protein